MASGIILNLPKSYYTLDFLSGNYNLYSNVTGVNLTNNGITYSIPGTTENLSILSGCRIILLKQNGWVSAISGVPGIISGNIFNFK